MTTTIREIISRLLPEGPNAVGSISSTACPAWPPDLFAVTAFLAERSGCYCGRRYTVGWESSGYYFDAEYRTRVRGSAEAWQRSAKPPPRVRRLWRDLINHRNSSLQTASSGWQDTVVELMAIADEASAGIGFSDKASLENPFARLLLDQHLALLKEEPLILKYIPQSICSIVPPTEACVQPKTNTPEVGCTLRSLSHNLALLPSSGLVATSWLFSSPRVQASQGPLNLLLVPYPYSVRTRDFASSIYDSQGTEVGFFSVNAASWLEVDVEKFSSFLHDLVMMAEHESADVHGIVLPETALPLDTARQIARRLSKSLPTLELFVAGVMDKDNQRNSAYTCRFFERAIFHETTQSKHHRWCLNRSQIIRYHLGSVLDPTKRWWEQIDVENRSCIFTEIREGTSLAVLVCEDLARADPVLPVVSSIGPNLVIALLLDGPQVEARWPGRYATVLADDPGSSVLTFTCIGMVRRFTMPGDPEARQIALWKEPDGSARELHLPQNAHALLLTLTFAASEQSTLDMRPDNEATKRLHLSGVRGVRTPTKPAWLALD